MAGIDVGDGGGRRRATNSDVNMIPFIDLLMVTIAFLLITAVWVTSSRIDADAAVPGPPGCDDDCKPGDVERRLHVHVNEDEFALVWKQGPTVIHEAKVPRAPVVVADGRGAVVRYPELAARLAAEWAERGVHRDPSDRAVDQAVLHTDDKLPFREIVAVLDAIHDVGRDARWSKDGRVAAFNTIFAER